MADQGDLARLPSSLSTKSARVHDAQDGGRASARWAAYGSLRRTHHVSQSDKPHSGHLDSLGHLLRAALPGATGRCCDRLRMVQPGILRSHAARTTY